MNVNFGISGRAGSGKDTFGNILLKVLEEKGLEYKQYAFAKPLKDFTRYVFLFTDYNVYDQDGKEQIQFMRYNEQQMKDRFKRGLKKLLRQLADNNDQVLSYEGDDPEKVLDGYWFTFKEVLSDTIVPKKFLDAFLEWVSPGKGEMTFNTSPRVLLQLIGTEFFRERIRNDFWTAIAPKTNVVITDMRFANEIDFLKECNGIAIGIERPSQTSIISYEHSSENVGPVLSRCDYIVTNDKDLDALKEWAESIAFVQIVKNSEV